MAFKGLSFVAGLTLGLVAEAVAVLIWARTFPIESTALSGISTAEDCQVMTLALEWSTKIVNEGIPPPPPGVKDTLDRKNIPVLPVLPALPHGPEPSGQRPSQIVCNWPQHGLKTRTIGEGEFKKGTSARLEGPYLAHLEIAMPRYSPLHLRASVETGFSFGMLAGQGFHCEFERTWIGWRRTSCLDTWVS